MNKKEVLDLEKALEELKAEVTRHGLPRKHLLDIHNAIRSCRAIAEAKSRK